MPRLLVTLVFGCLLMWGAGVTAEPATDAGGAPASAATAADEASSAPAASDEPDGQRPDYQTRSLRGEVVWMAEALQEHFGIRSVAEAQDRLLALETSDGRLYPIVEDVRGRAFRKDERLRDRPLELLVRQYEQSPMIQVVRMYALKEDGTYELDYWCDICAIAMFELKACDCCQGPVELRERKVDGVPGAEASP